MECRIRKTRARPDEELQLNCVPPREEQPSQREVRGEKEADLEVSETLLKSIVLPKIVVPTKFQVLNYVANAKSLQIRRTGSELQVTDSTGFPLLDVWLKTSCFRRGSSWVMESYGRTVLLMTDMEKSWWGRKLPHPPINPLHQGSKPTGPPAQLGAPSTSANTDANFCSSSSPKSTLQVLTPECETLGYFVVGDPFVLQNHEKKCIARFMPGGYEDSYISPPESPRLSSNDHQHQQAHPTNYCSSSTAPFRHLYQCLLEGNGQEIGRLESHPSHYKLMQLQFAGGTAMAFPLKLLVLASAVRLAATISSSTSCMAGQEDDNKQEITP